MTKEQQDLLYELKQILVPYSPKWNTVCEIEQLIMDYEKIYNNIKNYCEYNTEGLYTFEPDYDWEENMVDNYEPSSFREDIMSFLEGINDREK